MQKKTSDDDPTSHWVLRDLAAGDLGSVHSSIATVIKEPYFVQPHTEEWKLLSRDLSPAPGVEFLIDAFPGSDISEAFKHFSLEHVFAFPPAALMRITDQPATLFRNGIKRTRVFLTPGLEGLWQQEMLARYADRRRGVLGSKRDMYSVLTEHPVLPPRPSIFLEAIWAGGRIVDVSMRGLETLFENTELNVGDIVQHPDFAGGESHRVVALKGRQIGLRRLDDRGRTLTVDAASRVGRGLEPVEGHSTSRASAKTQSTTSYIEELSHGFELLRPGALKERLDSYVFKKRVGRPGFFASEADRRTALNESMREFSKMPTKRQLLQVLVKHPLWAGPEGAEAERWIKTPGALDSLKQWISPDTWQSFRNKHLPIR